MKATDESATNIESGANMSFQRTGAILAWYHLFGLGHEMAHLLSAWLLGLWTPPEEGGAVSFLPVIFKAILGRAYDLSTSNVTGIGQLSSDDIHFAVIRHGGWVASLTIALLVGFPQKSKHLGEKTSSLMQISAWITFFEAFCSDFLGIGVVAGHPHLLFCGNFGLILINSSWIDQDYGRKALGILEQMVHITMMRGAQSGGVIAWAVEKGDPMKARGIRSRVVNGKRTDLSKRLRRKVLADSFRFGKIRPGIQTFLGHTRFATSSKATFDGTHPHQWTPPQKRRVYQTNSSSVLASSSPQPKIGVVVENFITHNGDFDFYTVNNVQYGLSTVQQWLSLATGTPLRSSVDSLAIAGLIDLLRTEGCFGLSARYALLLNCSSSEMDTDIIVKLPPYSDFEHLGMAFESALVITCEESCTTMSEIKEKSSLRQKFASKVLELLMSDFFLDKLGSMVPAFVSMDEESDSGTSLQELVTRTIDAFFDNDLFQATRIFMSNAKGSFGLMVTSSLDANRQICLAARGQPISLAFYPKRGLVLYGSELAAVKAGSSVDMPSGAKGNNLTPMTICDVDDRDGQVVVKHTSRLDLDDLGGEIVLLDWEECGTPSANNVRVLAHQMSKTNHSQIASRMVLLENNEFIRPLTLETRDPVLDDIRDIPRVCKYIQDNWKQAGLNRHTAFNLVSKIKQRLVSRMKGSVPSHCNSIDILLTGCETSLWLAEQFASDLTKSFTRLNVKAVSSNKLLGMFGQDIAMPAVGFPMSENIPDLKGSVVIIVSHSGQTFAPLACSNLLQSFTNDIFLVTSEWDTQIGRQLRGIWKREHSLRPGLNDFSLILSSRIFSTDVGVRPAEPCSVSVAALQQLLTQLLMHVSISLLGESELRTFCGAVVTQSDLMVLERLNQESVNALECIVGSDRNGDRHTTGTKTEQELRRSGDVWSEHVLENPKAYIITFLYVVGTVVAGYPLITGVATAAGLTDGWAFYLCRFFDGLLYFFFHQLTVFTIRLLQGRNLHHRTTGRTVVIGDCPWVSQSADAFLSKLFACSYPMAGINVLSGNPADHLGHRLTHRLTRGTLLVCGRPDGRLSALTNAEISVCLSVNQASSIQNIGGSCESITIGHNPSPLAATSKDIFLSNHRPLFLCERVADDLDEAVRENDHPGTILKIPSFITGGNAVVIDLSRHSRQILDLSKHSRQNLDLSKHSHHIMDLSKHSHHIMDLSKHSRHIMDLSKHSRGLLDLSGPPFKVNQRSQYLKVDEHVIDAESLGDCSYVGPLDRAYHSSNFYQSSNAQKAGFSNLTRRISKKLSTLSGRIRQRSSTENIGHSHKNAAPVNDGSTIWRNGQIRNALEIKALYATFQMLAQAEDKKSDTQTVNTFANELEQGVVNAMLKERQGLQLMRRLFDELDAQKIGFISVDNFVGSYHAANGKLNEKQVRRVFKELEVGQDDGLITFDDFVRLSRMPEVEVIRKLQISAPRNEKGLLLVHPSEEEYFGQELQLSAAASGFEAFGLAKTQHFAMELYESRIASLERFVAMCVMFHQMGSRVQLFFEKLSFGLLGYRMDRTHSMMRIATTASPVSGADVRERMEALQSRAKIQNALRVIESAWYRYQQSEVRRWRKQKSKVDDEPTKSTERLSEVTSTHCTSNDAAAKGAEVEPTLLDADGKRKSSTLAAANKRTYRSSVGELQSCEITAHDIEYFFLAGSDISDTSIGSTQTAPTPSRRTGAPLSLATLISRKKRSSSQSPREADPEPAVSGQPDTKKGIFV